MKNIDIFKAIGNIDEKYIEESENYRGKKTTFHIASIAACLAVIIGFSVILPVLGIIEFPFNLTTTSSPVIQIPPKTYTVLETNMSSDSSALIKHKKEVQLIAKTTEEDVKKGLSKEITIDNMTLSGKYHETSVSPYYNCTNDTYNGKTNNMQVKLHFNPDTNKIVGYSTYDIDYLQKIGDKKELTQGECIDIAYNHLKKYVSDIENYKMTSNRFWESDAYKGAYTIVYNRYINGIETMDSALISVTQYGDIFVFYFNSLCEMKDVNVLNQHNLEDIERSIEKKCDEIYKDIKSDANYTINLGKSKRFVRLADGRYALEYTIYADITNVSTGKHFSDTSSLIVYLD